jgi:exopolysaccharide biosynthesis protein
LLQSFGDTSPTSANITIAENILAETIFSEISGKKESFTLINAGMFMASARDA